MTLNAIFLPPFLSEASILDGKKSAANLLKVFAKCIAVKGTEEEEDKSEEEEEDQSVIEGKDTENKIENSPKDNSETLATITAKLNDVLASLQAMAVKLPWIISAPLLLCANKCG